MSYRSAIYTSKHKLDVHAARNRLDGRKDSISFNSGGKLLPLSFIYKVDTEHPQIGHAEILIIWGGVPTGC